MSTTTPANSGSWPLPKQPPEMHPATGIPVQLPFHVLPVIQEAEGAFRTELPGLLQTHANEWVAYSGRNRVAFARTKSDLYRACLRQGLQRGRFLVRRICPQQEEIRIGPREIG
jgi:hypothetical protein